MSKVTIRNNVVLNHWLTFCSPEVTQAINECLAKDYNRYTERIECGFAAFFTQYPSLEEKDLPDLYVSVANEVAKQTRRLFDEQVARNRSFIDISARVRATFYLKDDTFTGAIYLVPENVKAPRYVHYPFVRLQ